MVATELEDGGLSATQQQLGEPECMLSMFPDEEEVKVDMAAKTALEEFVADDDRTVRSSRPECRIQYTLYYKVCFKVLVVANVIDVMAVPTSLCVRGCTGSSFRP